MRTNENVPLQSPRVGSLKTAGDVIHELGRLYRAMRRGEVAPGDGAKLGYILNILRQTQEAGELERRLEALEGRAADLTAGSATIARRGR